MLLREKNPRVMIKIGNVFLIFFFLMNAPFVPHPASKFGDGFFDGIHGALLGIGGTLILWGVYLNGRNRRAHNRS